MRVAWTCAWIAIVWPLSAAAQTLHPLPTAPPAALSPAAPSTPLRVDLGRGERVDFVLVRAGDVEQGSPSSEAHRGPDEARRPVTITTDFFVATTPVTRGAFEVFARETRYETEAERGASGGFGWDGTKLVQRKEFTWRNPGFPQTKSDPVVLVTYDDALAFARWLEGVAGHAVTLPTEAQYEYAARAGTTAPFYAPDPLAIGWFEENAGAGTRPVAQKTPNAFGLYDMSGDVYEWCRDWYGPYPSGAAVDPLVDVAPTGDTARRVLRGGSWMKSSDHGRSAARWRNTPGSRNADNGFRVVADVALLAVAPSPTARTESASPTNGGAAKPSAPARRGSGLAFGLLGIGGAAITLGAMIWALRRRGPRTTARLDGFVLSGVPVGTRVIWTAIVRGLKVSDQVTATGRATFVYTGDRPGAIRIVNVAYPRPMEEARGFRESTPWIPSPTYVVPVDLTQPREDEDARRRSFRGYPPAY